MVAFAGSGDNSRTTQIFFALANHFSLGHSPWETALGFVTPETMSTIDKVYTGYGDGAPWGNGPSQGRINAEGNAYLRSEFPLLDYIHECHVVDVNDPCQRLDSFPQCSTWATPGSYSKEGECVRNPTWANINCPRACATCGKDETPGAGKDKCSFEMAECLPWAVPGIFSAEGECVNNPKWMAQHCGRVCAHVTNCL